jgi:hypothetical protein
MCVFLCLCTGRGLATSWSPAQGVLSTVYDSEKKPKWNGEFHGGRPRPTGAVVPMKKKKALRSANHPSKESYRLSLIKKLKKTQPYAPKREQAPTCGSNEDEKKMYLCHDTQYTGTEHFSHKNAILQCKKMSSVPVSNAKCFVKQGKRRTSEEQTWAFINCQLTTLRHTDNLRAKSLERK